MSGRGAGGPGRSKRGGGGGGSSSGGRGSRGGRGNKPHRGSRVVPSMEEVLARNAAAAAAASSSADSADESEEHTDQEDDDQQQQQQQNGRRQPFAQLADDDGEPLIGAGNLNRGGGCNGQSIGPSRREREAQEKAKQAALMQKLQAEGKTSRAKADLARLAEVRRRREEAEKAKATP